LVFPLDWWQPIVCECNRQRLYQAMQRKIAMRALDASVVVRTGFRDWGGKTPHWTDTSDHFVRDAFDRKQEFRLS
jgi:hypothetical protein